jgi:hypothetical protein
MKKQRFEEVYEKSMLNSTGLIGNEKLCRSVCETYVSWLETIDRNTEKPLGEFLQSLNEESKDFFLMGYKERTPLLALQIEMDCLIDKDQNVLKLHEQPRYVRLSPGEFLEEYCNG